MDNVYDAVDRVICEHDVFPTYSLPHPTRTPTGIPTYEEKWADGLQVLRYNATNCYVPHLDWMDPAQVSLPEIPEGYRYDPNAAPGSPTSGATSEYLHDFRSSDYGTNRFATIFLYLSDLEDGNGGETVFPLLNSKGIPDIVSASEKEQNEKDTFEFLQGAYICICELQRLPIRCRKRWPDSECRMQTV